MEMKELVESQTHENCMATTAARRLNQTQAAVRVYKSNPSRLISVHNFQLVI